MIVEGIVTSLGEGGAPHIAPMGPEVEGDFLRIRLRPFISSQTFQNLRQRPEGVFHVVDDAELVARAAIGLADPALGPARSVRGHIILDACRYFEFRVARLDASSERAVIDCEVVASGRLRDFNGFNRARHAVLEAAILATRAGFLPIEEIRRELSRLETPLRKTGGPKELEAFRLLVEHVERIARERTGSAAAGAPRVLAQSVPAAARVRAASRLHFGLLAPAGGLARRFGGVGAMVREPSLELTAAPAVETCAEGPLAERAAEFARRAVAAARAKGIEAPAARLVIGRAPPEHAGLGTGTQLGMAVARALAELSGERSLPAEELARRAGRGERSGVGLHGFLRGGLLVDGGRRASPVAGASPPEPAAAPLVARAEIPAAWRFVLFFPTAAIAPRGLSGPAEREAFRRLSTDAARAAAMSRAVLLGLLPAAAEEDLPAFGAALGELQDLAGESFREAQGGLYAAPELEEVVRAIRAGGIPGAGQSSWGPTLFAVVGDEERGRHLARSITARFSRLEIRTTVSAPANSGASVEPAPR